MQGNLHSYLQEIYRGVISKYTVMRVSEDAGNNFEDAYNLADAQHKELNMALAFNTVDIAEILKNQCTDFWKYTLLNKKICLQRGV